MAGNFNDIRNKINILDGLVRGYFYSFKTVKGKRVLAIPPWLLYFRISIELEVALRLLTEDLPRVAKEYRFYCEELHNQHKRQYTELLCTTAKAKMRAIISAVRQLISDIKNLLKNNNIQYRAWSETIQQLEAIIVLFESDPSRSLKEIENLINAGIDFVQARRKLEEYEHKLRVELLNLQHTLQSVVRALRYYGIIRKSEEGFICPVCGLPHDTLEDVINCLRRHGETVESSSDM